MISIREKSIHRLEKNRFFDYSISDRHPYCKISSLMTINKHRQKMLRTTDKRLYFVCYKNSCLSISESGSSNTCVVCAELVLSSWLRSFCLSVHNSYRIKILISLFHYPTTCYLIGNLIKYLDVFRI